VLVVITAAVAMLGVLVSETQRQGEEILLADDLARQEMLSERLVAAAIAVRSAPEARREQKRQYVAAIAREWSEGSAQLRGEVADAPAIRRDTPPARTYAALAPLEREILAAARETASEHPRRTAAAALEAKQRRYVEVMAGVLLQIESDEIRRVEWLMHVEAVCVILLLAALGVAVRLALQPTQQELQRTVAALEESEARTRAVLDSMDEGMLLFDAAGRMLKWNPGALRILGIDAVATEMTLQSVAPRLVDEQGKPIPVDELPNRVTLRTGEPMSDIAMGVVDETGEPRWLSVNTHPLFREPGEVPYAVVLIFRDVTTERRANEERTIQAEALALQNSELMAQADALARSEALYRSLVDTAGSAIVGLDRDGRVFEWNREAEALYGILRADAIGCLYAEEFIPSRHQAVVAQGIAAVLGGQTLRSIAGPVRSRTGERRTVLWNIAPLRGGEGVSVHGMIAAGHDITEREASDERFRVLFERSSDAHLLFGEEGVIDCNDAALRMLRYTDKTSVLGKSAVDLSPRRQPDGRLSLIVGQQMRQLARLRGYYRFTWMHRRADGTEFPVEVTLTPVRLDGREVILAVWHDITEQKKVEDALRAAKDAAESANHTKSDFMARMNHELRTPLTAIIGFSRVLLQEKAGALSEGAKGYVERVRANGMHLLSLINQILDVAKVEAGRMELELDTVEVDVLVRETLAMLETTAETKGLVIRSEMPSRVAPMVTDGGKLRQILINLVGNAVKFTTEGEVCVRVETDPVTHRPVAIVIQDTGIGIPPERQRKVFEPFEQGDSTTRHEFGGTGLGLAIVKAFSELIGARIEVASEVGRGTTFTLRLAKAAVLGSSQRAERSA
jgi:PAS domain S-box-containing protein